MGRKRQHRAYALAAEAQVSRPDDPDGWLADFEREVAESIGTLRELLRTAQLAKRKLRKVEGRTA